MDAVVLVLAILASIALTLLLFGLLVNRRHDRTRQRNVTGTATNTVRPASAQRAAPRGARRVAVERCTDQVAGRRRRRLRGKQLRRWGRRMRLRPMPSAVAAPAL